jgi:hypothetical protein
LWWFLFISCTFLFSPGKQHWIPWKVHSVSLFHKFMAVKHCAPDKDHVIHFCPFLSSDLDWVPFITPSPWMSWPPSF